MPGALLRLRGADAAVPLRRSRAATKPWRADRPAWILITMRPMAGTDKQSAEGVAT